MGILLLVQSLPSAKLSSSIYTLCLKQPPIIAYHCSHIYINTKHTIDGKHGRTRSVIPVNQWTPLDTKRTKLERTTQQIPRHARNNIQNVAIRTKFYISGMGNSNKRGKKRNRESELFISQQ